MAYKLVDQNGKLMTINNKYKGYIYKPEPYYGMELYNETYMTSRYYPFYSTYRRIKINGSYYYPSGTTKYYTTAAYAATEVAINGRYYNTSYQNYEVYKDGVLVASGTYTSTAADIYTCEKEANTSIIISGDWDSTNSKYIYNITTNATIIRTTSYQWDNSTTQTVTWNRTELLGKIYTANENSNGITTINFVSEDSFKQSVATYLGIDVSQIVSITNYQWVNYWYNSRSYSTNIHSYWVNNSTQATWAEDNQNGHDIYSFTVTATPYWSTQIAPKYQYTDSSGTHGPYNATGSVNHPGKANNASYPWTFTFTVKYRPPLES